MNTTEPISTETEKLKNERHEVDLKPQELPRITTPVPVSEPKRENENFPEQTDSEKPVRPDDVPHNSNEISFACLLIPRFSDHFLVGDITQNLPVWMRQICISYGWRLDGIVVRPGYLQWLLAVPHTANPAQFIRVTRQHTSLKIFNDFPRFKQKNLSNDFWAPGYFVTSGNQLHSQESISDFILLTRKYQGIV